MRDQAPRIALRTRRVACRHDAQHPDLVLFPGAFGLYHLVDNAPYDSWLYGS